MVLLSVIYHDNFKSLQSVPMRLYFILSPLMHWVAYNYFLMLYKFRL